MFTFVVVGLYFILNTFFVVGLQVIAVVISLNFTVEGCYTLPHHLTDYFLIKLC